MKKLVITADLKTELVDANWEVFCHVVHFVAKKRIVVSEEEAVKAREKSKQRAENPSLSSHAHINVQKLSGMH